MFDDENYGINVRAETRRLNGRKVTIQDWSGKKYCGRLDINKYTNGVSIFGEDGETSIRYREIAEVHEQ